MADHPEPTGVMKLYDGRAFESDADDESVWRNSITRHCKAMYNEPDGNTFTTEQRKAAEIQLSHYKKHIVNKLVKKLRSVFVSNLRDLNYPLDSFAAVAARLNGSEVSLDFVEKVFKACFTWPEENNAGLCKKIALKVIAEEGILFYKTEGKNVKPGVTALEDLIKVEALHSARKPIMKGGNNGENTVYMSTRRGKKGADWTAKLNRKPKRQDFSYDKVSGWEHLIHYDPIAKQVFFQYHNHCEPGEKPRLGMKPTTTVSAAASVASTASAGRSSSADSAAVVTKGSPDDAQEPPHEIGIGMKKDNKESKHFLNAFGGGCNGSQEKDDPEDDQLLATSQKDGSAWCNDDESVGRDIWEGAATTMAVYPPAPKRHNSEMSAMTEA
jgi:hypothetical protein